MFFLTSGRERLIVGRIVNRLESVHHNDANVRVAPQSLVRGICPFKDSQEL